MINKAYGLSLLLLLCRACIGWKWSSHLLASFVICQCMMTLFCAFRHYLKRSSGIWISNDSKSLFFEHEPGWYLNRHWHHTIRQVVLKVHFKIPSIHMAFSAGCMVGHKSCFANSHIPYLIKKLRSTSKGNETQWFQLVIIIY